jgi:hypothetical protein
MVTNTSTYHIAYAVATTVYVAYMLSLWMRGRQLRRRVGELQRTRR